MFSPPLSDSEGSVRNASIAVNDRWRPYFVLRHNAHISHRFAKLPTRLKKILSSRVGLGIFERVITVLNIRPAGGRAQHSFCIAAVSEFSFGRRLILGQDSGRHLSDDAQVVAAPQASLPEDATRRHYAMPPSLFLRSAAARGATTCG
jgi:hypothetical protein